MTISIYNVKISKGDNMENFIKQNFDINYVARARKLPTSSKKSVNIVRRYNVFIFMKDCEKDYILKELSKNSI